MFNRALLIIQNLNVRTGFLSSRYNIACGKKCFKFYKKNLLQIPINVQALATGK